jgi:hypothetical protein
MTALITRHFKIHNAIQFFESFSETAPTRYYFFIGKTAPYANALPITGTVKTTSSSNTIIGQGTYFDSQLAVGDRIGVTGQSGVVRVHSIGGAQTMVVTPRPSVSITTGANAYNRKLYSELVPPDVDPSYQNTYYDVWRNMIALKKFQTSDVSHVVPRYQWTSGTVYSEYDDNDASLYEKQFYASTTEGRVYKCIDNNQGVVSTVKPTTTDSSNIELTSDGYRWKYMYTISSGEALKFQTNAYMPVKTLSANDGSAQWSVQQSASNGAIQHVKILAGGTGYLSTTNTFQTIVNASFFVIKSNASAIDGSYVGSSLYISEGAGSGQIRKVVKYWGANNTLVVNSAFTSSPNTTSRYVISPTVTIRGDSGLTAVSRATAYVSNTFGGLVRRVTIVSQGRSYSSANVIITANSVYGRGAAARPIISPRGGHGKDPVDELFGTSIIMNVKVAGSESNTFPTNNDFRVIGVVRDPVLANGSYANSSVIDQTTRISLKEVSGDFVADEIVTGRTSGAKARVVYFANNNTAKSNGILKVIRVSTSGVGQSFEQSEIIVGTTSAVTANVQLVTKPALQQFSGIVIYTENRTAIARSPEQTEDFKIVIKY